MPLPKWLAQINKRGVNKMELKRGKRPVLSHVGRSSGTTYHTPLDAHPVDNGFIFMANYGSSSDWVKNIMASGTAHLTKDGEDFDLVSPRLVSKDAAFEQMSADTKELPKFLNVTDFLQMDVRR